MGESGKIGDVRTQARIAVAVLAMTVALAAPSVHAQTYSVIYNFAGGADGDTPIGGVTVDAAGSLYGTTSAGGRRGCGNVYRLAHTQSGWNFYLLYTFRGDTENDGSSPFARVVIGPDGYLYGSTHSGGNGDGCRNRYGCGTVFRVAPKPGGGPLDPWMETVLHRFGTYDGSDPSYGDLVFDGAGNLFGVTRDGGAYLQGAVYELHPKGGVWSERVVHSFAGTPDGAAPQDGPFMDAAGTLYGATSAGGEYGYGTVYELRPVSVFWRESVLHSFAGTEEGVEPSAGVFLDAAGNLYGATQSGGAGGGGTLYQLQPHGEGWNLSTLHNLAGPLGGGPYSTPVMDRDGNLYGTASADGAYGQGSVFKLSWSQGQWSYTSLHDFTGGADGGAPVGRLALDANGNLYGTASLGGAYGNGVVFKIAAQ